jgi:hypothetical protein
MASDVLRLEDSDDSAIEAEIVHGMMILKAEQEDAENGPGAFIRVHFMPSKAQAASLAAMLSRWAETRA